MIVDLAIVIGLLCLAALAINWLADTRFGLFLERHMPDDDDFYGNGRHPRDAFPNERN